jgi:hypothetical protein
LTRIPSGLPPETFSPTPVYDFDAASVCVCAWRQE